MSLTRAREGGGFPLQKFERTHTVFRSTESFVFTFSCVHIAWTMPVWPNKMSRVLGESPAMLPSPQIACESTRRSRGLDQKMTAANIGSQHLYRLLLQANKAMDAFERAYQ